MTALDVGDRIVAREPLVQERVVRGEQLEHAPRCADRTEDAVDDVLRFAAHRRAQRFVEVREEDFVRLLRLEVAKKQPLRGEVRHQRF